MRGLEAQTNSGLSWTAASRVAIAILALIKIGVLSRFMTAEAFGLMAIIVVVIGFVDLFIDMGLTSAILHHNNISSEDFGALYWFGLLFGCLVYVALYAVAPLIAAFYSEPALTELTRVSAIGILLSSLGRQFLAMDQKAMRFSRIAVAEVFASIFGMIVGVWLAVKGVGVYALVLSMLAQFTVLNLVYLYIGMRKFRPPFSFQLFRVWPFLRIGLFQMGGQTMTYFSKELDVILVGKLLGPEILGGYSLAKQLVNKPVSIVNPIINRVATPVLSVMKGDAKQTKWAFFSFTKLISTVMAVTYGLLILSALPIVYVLYGEAYLSIVPIVQILCMYMFLRALGNPLGSLVVATGRTDYGFYWSMFTTAVLPVAVYAGAEFGGLGVAFALLSAMTVLTISRWYLLVRKLIDGSFFEYCFSLLPSSKQLVELMTRRFTLQYVEKR